MEHKAAPQAPVVPALPLPDDNPKTKYGHLKAPLHLVPASAVIEEAWVMQLGARKYGAFNWRAKTVSATIYQAAALRHLLAWFEGEDVDAESGRSHLAHVRACMAILIDAERCGRLNDDRPNAGLLGGPAF
jgi:hypothetical protein